MELMNRGCCYDKRKFLDAICFCVYTLVTNVARFTPSIKDHGAIPNSSVTAQSLTIAFLARLQTVFLHLPKKNGICQRRRLIFRGHFGSLGS